MPRNGLQATWPRLLRHFGPPWLTLLVLVSIVAVIWQTGRHRQGLRKRVLRPSLMGTTSQLVGVGRPSQLEPGLATALRELGMIAQSMSTYQVDSELSRFNAAPADRTIQLSQPMWEVLQAASVLVTQTEGAFDVTMRPLGRLWRAAEQRGTLPTAAEIEEARRVVGSEFLVLSGGAARKTRAGVELTLDGIAKGYAVHRAIMAMRRAGLAGGLVDVGGDVECFGKPLDAPAWRIGLQHPYSDSPLLILQAATEGNRTWAVCTSGDYRRYVEIDGQRFSHILDPRSGQPARMAASVTVVAADAMTADAWATALSVLGPEAGLALVERQADLEALIVCGGQERLKLHKSSGFARFMAPSDR